MEDNFDYSDNLLPLVLSETVLIAIKLGELEIIK